MKKMYTRKQIIILAVLILVLAGGFLYQRIWGWPWSENLPKPSNGATISPQVTPPISGSESPAAKEPREIVMEDVAQKIGQISPVEPVLGGHWFIDRFWFINGSYNSFYVEYEDGHILRRLLLTADTSQAPANITYHIDAYFEPGESDWVLKSGQDQTSGRQLVLYEYDQSKQSWSQKN